MEQMVAVIAVILVGPMVGVELSVALVVNPTADRLPREAAVRSRSITAGSQGRFMPFWYAASLTVTAAWAAVSWSQPGAWLAVVSAVLLALSVAMSVVLLVPINKQVAAWSTAGAAADWEQLVHRWDRLHYARVAIIMVAFALLVWGLVR